MQMILFTQLTVEVWFSDTLYSTHSMILFTQLTVEVWYSIITQLSLNPV